MTSSEEKILTLRSDPGWAEYVWRETLSVWRYTTGSEGFLKQHSLPTTFTEQERLLLQIKHT